MRTIAAFPPRTQRSSRVRELQDVDKVTICRVDEGTPPVQPLGLGSPEPSRPQWSTCSLERRTAGYAAAEFGSCETGSRRTAWPVPLVFVNGWKRPDSLPRRASSRVTFIPAFGSPAAHPTIRDRSPKTRRQAETDDACDRDEHCRLHDRQRRHDSNGRTGASAASTCLRLTDIARGASATTPIIPAPKTAAAGRMIGIFAASHRAMRISERPFTRPLPHIPPPPSQEFAGRTTDQSPVLDPWPARKHRYCSSTSRERRTRPWGAISRRHCALPVPRCHPVG
jgi:hypothetical protein